MDKAPQVPCLMEGAEYPHLFQLPPAMSYADSAKFNFDLKSYSYYFFAK